MSEDSVPVYPFLFVQQELAIVFIISLLFIFLPHPFNLLHHLLLCLQTHACFEFVGDEFPETFGTERLVIGCVHQAGYCAPKDIAVVARLPLQGGDEHVVGNAAAGERQHACNASGHVADDHRHHGSRGGKCEEYIRELPPYPEEGRGTVKAAPYSVLHDQCGLGEEDQTYELEKDEHDHQTAAVLEEGSPLAYLMKVGTSITTPTMPMMIDTRLSSGLAEVFNVELA